ncbi:MAG: hypothetical protein ACI9W6_001150 [Motiliproteus sp.]|jgi:hypothetical protein
MSIRLSRSERWHFSRIILSGVTLSYVTLSYVTLSYVLISALSTNASAVEPSQGMTITGDKELPLVLYIIPWKEQQPRMPATPKADNPFLVPLTPCDTGQTLTGDQATLWNCKTLESPSKP